MEDLLLALREGGRLAAASGTRDGRRLDRARTAPPTPGAKWPTMPGCPKKPELADHRRQCGLFARRQAYPLPRGVPRTVRTARCCRCRASRCGPTAAPVSGFLVPDIQYSRNNGLELNGSYYLRLGDQPRPHPHRLCLYRGGADGQRRSTAHLTDLGAYQATGYAHLQPPVRPSQRHRHRQRPVSRLHHIANGRFQLDPNWSVDQLAAPRQRPHVPAPLRHQPRRPPALDVRRSSGSTTARISSIAGWATQTLLLSATAGAGAARAAADRLPQAPRRPRAAAAASSSCSANTLALARADGQDTQRAFAGAQWDLQRDHRAGPGADAHRAGPRRCLPFRRERADRHRDLSRQPGLAGARRGARRGRPRMAVRRPRFSAAPRCSPRACRSSPARRSATWRFPTRMPARSTSRTPTCSRSTASPATTGSRTGRASTYGVDWQLDLPRLAHQHHDRPVLSPDRNRASILPDGTGLTERMSDFVGRTEVRFSDFVKLTHRFRLDKDSLAVRRNEIDATVGTRPDLCRGRLPAAQPQHRRRSRTCTTARNCASPARVAFASYWSVFGSGVFNLTDQRGGPDAHLRRLPAAAHPAGRRLSRTIASNSGVTWRRDYVDQGDARRGNTFQRLFRAQEPRLPLRPVTAVGSAPAYSANAPRALSFG